MEQLLQVGVISSTHGVRGEVKVYPTTDDVRRFKKLKNVILDTGRGYLTLEIEGVKFFKQFVILKFKDFDNINDIEKYKGKSLLVDRANAVRLRRNEYFIADMIGLPVFHAESGESLGTLSDVNDIAGRRIYSVKYEGREVLIPDVPEFIKEISEEGGMRVMPIPGLFDLADEV